MFGKLGVTITHSFSISSTRSNLDFQIVPFLQKVPRSALLELSFSVLTTWTLLVAPKLLSLAIVQQEVARIIKNDSRKSDYSTTGRSITFKIPIMNAVDATAIEHNLQLTVSPNLSLSVTTTLEVTRDAEARIKIVKDEFKQVGSHKILRKGIIQLTASECSRLKTSFETIDSSISFVNQNAKQTTTGPDGGTQYQTA